MSTKNIPLINQILSELFEKWTKKIINHKFYRLSTILFPTTCEWVVVVFFEREGDGERES